MVLQDRKRVTCDVCGSSITPCKEGICTASPLLFGMALYDYMNCPNCGCQVILKKRLTDIGRADDNVETEEEETDETQE